MSPTIATYPLWKDLYGKRPSVEEVRRILRNLDRLHTVLLLARMNMHLALDRYHSEPRQSAALQGFLVSNFIDDDVLARLRRRYGSEQLVARQPFHLQQILTLTKWAALKGSLSGGARPDEDREARYELGRALLMTNDLLMTTGGQAAISRFRASFKRRLVALQLQLGSGLEVNNPPFIKASIIRSEMMFGEISAQFNFPLDVRSVFKERTGLELDQYVDLIFGLLIFYITREQDQLIAEPGIFLFNPDSFFRNVEKDEVQKFLSMELSTLDEMVAELQKPSNLKPQHDFIGFRKKPLLRVSENGAVCINPGFLQEKLESGLFWSIFNSLGTDKERGLLFQTWGMLFERYVSYLLTEPFQGKVEKYIGFPRFADNNEEAFDGIVTAESKWFVLEYKGGFLKTEAKYAENEEEFIRDLRLKFGTAPGAGVEQLARKIGQVFCADDSKRRRLSGIGSSGVSIVVPMMVVQEPFVSSELSSRYLCDEFRYLLRKEKLRKDIVCTGLQVLDVGDIENIRAYISSGQCSFSDCLMGRAQLGDRAGSFRDYFRQYFQENNLKAVEDKDLETRVRKIFDRLSIRFFGRSFAELDREAGPAP